MRRYFDEYRGLRETIGHVEPFGLRSPCATSARQVAARPAVHGRARRRRRRPRALDGAVAGAPRAPQGVLGARLARRRAAAAPCSARCRSSGAPAAPPAAIGAGPTARRRTPAPADGSPVRCATGRRRCSRRTRGWPTASACTSRSSIPTFSIGSGGHYIDLPARRAARAHGPHLLAVGARPVRPPARRHRRVLRREITESFAPLRAPVFREFDDWYGADVVVATGWQTVYPVLLLDGCRARAYLINDHEPEFFATSVESEWAERTYRQGLYGIAGSPWLQDLYVDRYGGTPERSSTAWITTSTARGRSRAAATRSSPTRARSPRGAPPRWRSSRSRRCGAAGPTCGSSCSATQQPLDAPFAYEHPGVAGHEELAWLFSEATAGLCLSMTNYSLLPQEMLACGLPCVDLDRPSARSVFGEDGPVVLAGLRPGGARRRDRAAARRRGRVGAPLAARPRVRPRPHVGRRRRPGRARAAQRAAGATVAERRPHAALVALMAVSLLLAVTWAAIAARVPGARRAVALRLRAVARRALRAARRRWRGLLLDAGQRGDRSPSTPTRSPRSGRSSPSGTRRSSTSGRRTRDAPRDDGGGRARPPPTRRPRTPGGARLRRRLGRDAVRRAAGRAPDVGALAADHRARDLAAGRRGVRPPAAAAGRRGRGAGARADGRVRLSASVSPDGMLYAVWSLALWLGVRCIRRGVPARDGAAFFALVGIACTIKAASYALLVPAALVAVVGSLARRPWQVGRRPAARRGRRGPVAAHARRVGAGGAARATGRRQPGRRPRARRRRGRTGASWSRTSGSTTCRAPRCRRATRCRPAATRCCRSGSRRAGRRSAGSRSSSRPGSTACSRC